MDSGSLDMKLKGLLSDVPGILRNEFKLVGEARLSRGDVLALYKVRIEQLFWAYKATRDEVKAKRQERLDSILAKAGC